MWAPKRGPSVSSGAQGCTGRHACDVADRGFTCHSSCCRARPVLPPAAASSGTARRWWTLLSPTRAQPHSHQPQPSSLHHAVKGTASHTLPCINSVLALPACLLQCMLWRTAVCTSNSNCAGDAIFRPSRALVTWEAVPQMSKPESYNLSHVILLQPVRSLGSDLRSRAEPRLISALAA